MFEFVKMRWIPSFCNIENLVTMHCALLIRNQLAHDIGGRRHKELYRIEDDNASKKGLLMPHDESQLAKEPKHLPDQILRADLVLVRYLRDLLKREVVGDGLLPLVHLIQNFCKLAPCIADANKMGESIYITFSIRQLENPEHQIRMN